MAVLNVRLCDDKCLTLGVLLRKGGRKVLRNNFYDCNLNILYFYFLYKFDLNKLTNCWIRFLFSLFIYNIFYILKVVFWGFSFYIFYEMKRK